MYQVYDHVLQAVKDTSISVDIKFQTMEERTSTNFEEEWTNTTFWDFGPNFIWSGS